MKVEFIGHSSILIKCGQNQILCDPWYTGNAFNNGWKLLVETNQNIADLNFNHIWYSHEHPDHFSTSDLKKIDENKKKYINIFFQETKDKKIKNFCENLGFNFTELKSYEPHNLDKDLTIMCNPDGFDSWLYVKYKEKSLLNLNDCRLNDREEIFELKNKIGNLDVLFTQFGYANWAGNNGDEETPKLAREIVHEQLKNQIEILNPKVVVPFASFIWFCHKENAYWNKQSINIDESYKFLKTLCSQVHVFYPKDSWIVGDTFTKSKKNIQLYLDTSLQRKTEELLTSQSFSILELNESFVKMRGYLIQKNNWDEILKIRKKLHDSVVLLTDINKKIIFDITADELVETDRESDIELSSESLIYLMKYKWGRGTLMINARFKANYKSFDNFFKQTAIYYANNIGLSYPDSFTEEQLLNQSSFALDVMRKWDIR